MERQKEHRLKGLGHGGLEVRGPSRSDGGRKGGRQGGGEEAGGAQRSGHGIVHESHPAGARWPKRGREGARGGQTCTWPAVDTWRLNVLVSFRTRRLAPVLKDFGAIYPKVEVEFGLNDRVVDLIDESWDLAVRIGKLASSRMVSRKLAPFRTVICATPSYVEANGAPRTVAELAAHNCLSYTLSERMGVDRWSFGTDGSLKARVSDPTAFFADLLQLRVGPLIVSW